MSDPGPAILDFVRAETEAFVELCERLVRIESPTDHPDTQKGVFEVLASELTELGFRTRHYAGKRSGGQFYARPARPEPGAPLQLCVGHADTVWPLGTLDEMPVERVGGKLKGPGVFDMKAGLAAVIFALRALRAVGARPVCTPVLFVNSDEETGSAESTNRLRLLARRVERVFVLEPAAGSEGRIKTGRKGVGRFVVRAIGRAAHAGLNPEGGASAIQELSHAIQALFALNDPERHVTVNVGQIQGGVRPNVIAPEADAVVDVRVPNAEEARRIEEAIHSLESTTDGVRLEVEGRVGRPPLERTPRNRRLWEMAQAAAKPLGLQLEEAVVGGASDGNTTSQFAATLDGLGAVGGGAHARHEFIRVEETMGRVALLARLLLCPPVRETASGEEER